MSAMNRIVRRLPVRCFDGTRQPRNAVGLTDAAVTLAVLAAIVLGPGILRPGSAEAAELRLRAQCQSRGGLVTLGDVAEIFATDPRQAETLAALELFPAPAASHQRFVRIREIQDLLLSRGINLAEHRFSGSSRVAILGAEPVRAAQQLPLSSAERTRANRRIQEAVLQYLQQGGNVSVGRSWTVEVELDANQVRLAAGAAHAISITGGAAPWTGWQRFEATVQTPEGPVRFPLDAQVAAPPAVLVAARLLPRGTLLRAADGARRHDLPREDSSAGFHSIDEVIGRETVQAIGEGKMLRPKMVRFPLLVRRRDVLRVTARNAGVLVRTMARARDDGSLGDWIAVESLQDRETYFARVSGLREVEVYARSVRAGPASVGGGPSPLAR